MSGAFDPYSEWFGIARHEHPIDHYRLLGLKRFETSEAAIREAAKERRRRLKGVRSEELGDERQRSARRLLDEVEAARLCLLDAGSRTAYDRMLGGPGERAPAALSATPPLDCMLPPGAPSPIAAVPPPPPTGAAAGIEEDATAGEEEEDEPRPLAARLIFPLALVVGSLLLATIIAGSGLLLMWYWPAAENAAGDDGEREDARADEGGGEEPGDSSIPAPVVEQGDDGELLLTAETAQLSGPGIKAAGRGGSMLLTGFNSELDRASWQCRVRAPGPFDVEITYAEPGAGGRYRLEVSDVQQHHKDGTVREGRAGEVITDRQFLFIDRSGDCTITLRPLEVPAGQLFVLKSIRLRPR